MKAHISISIHQKHPQSFSFHPSYLSLPSDATQGEVGRVASVHGTQVGLGWLAQAGEQDVSDIPPDTGAARPRCRLRGQHQLVSTVHRVVGGPRALGLVGIGSGGEGGVTEVKGLLTLTGRCP